MYFYIETLSNIHLSKLLLIISLYLREIKKRKQIAGAKKTEKKAAAKTQNVAKKINSKGR